MMMKLKWIILFAITPVAVLLDQVTKILISRSMDLYESIDIMGSLVRFTLVHNRGMVFGINPHNTFSFLPVDIILKSFMLIATIGLCVYYVMNKQEDKYYLAGLSLILAGAFGNLIDRLLHDRVVDFIDVGISERLRWPIFNLADSWVTIGIGIFLAISIFRKTPIHIQSANGES